LADDAADRNALVPIALARAAARGVRDVPPDRVIVVGDTPADVACARAAGVRAVGVATGPYDTATLAASGAHAVLPDLSDLPAFLSAMQL
jgi:phosphoglycolate phosphatase-like HAD superfamily hydrolase